MKAVVLAGGTGGAKLAAGFQSLLPAGDLTVIANTADDDEFWGLLVSPDVDATIYRLAGIFDDAAGYGQKGDTFQALEALGRLGEPTWFRIGDRDLATHVLRAEMLNGGCRLTETALELCRRVELASHLSPMCHDKVRRRLVIHRRGLSFSEEFLRARHAPRWPGGRNRGDGLSGDRMRHGHGRRRRGARQGDFGGFLVSVR